MTGILSGKWESEASERGREASQDAPRIARLARTGFSTMYRAARLVIPVAVTDLCVCSGHPCEQPNRELCFGSGPSWRPVQDKVHGSPSYSSSMQMTGCSHLYCSAIHPVPCFICPLLAWPVSLCGTQRQSYRDGDLGEAVFMSEVIASTPPCVENQGAVHEEDTAVEPFASHPRPRG